jgi:hypothetical protein
MLEAARWQGRDFANAQRGPRDESPATVDRMLSGSTGKGLRLLWEAAMRPATCRRTATPTSIACSPAGRA